MRIEPVPQQAFFNFASTLRRKRERDWAEQLEEPLLADHPSLDIEGVWELVPPLQNELELFVPGILVWDPGTTFFAPALGVGVEEINSELDVALGPLKFLVLVSTLPHIAPFRTQSVCVERIVIALRPCVGNSQEGLSEVIGERAIFDTIIKKLFCQEEGILLYSGYYDIYILLFSLSFGTCIWEFYCCLGFAGTP